eukprot:TRINITY_DN7729_c0_g1_i2.p1 TRINITY_DN7729_c0_g1~~TRINITY_DN7729_c0_g1_i2.p1  ORF type:complete len:800 (-),score=148.08 TRINITY_DN7729_c0_g1_i2:40-2079(-)
MATHEEASYYSEDEEISELVAPHEDGSKGIRRHSNVPNMGVGSPGVRRYPESMGPGEEDPYYSPKTYQHGTPRGLTQRAQEAHHRRTVSWDPPSIILPPGVPGLMPPGSPNAPPPLSPSSSFGALGQLLRDKKEALLQRERELMRVKERQQALRQQQWAAQQQQQQQQQQQTSPVPPTRSPRQVASPPPAQPPQPQTISKTRSSHHHRSKSDPNVIPILMRGLQMRGVANAGLPAGRGSGVEGVRGSPSPRAHMPEQVPSGLRASSSPRSALSPNNVPMSDDGMDEIAELEELIGLRHMHLVEKGLLPPLPEPLQDEVEAPYVPSKHQRKFSAGGIEYRLEEGRVVLDQGRPRDWDREREREHELMIPETLMNSLVEDIEEEIEWIRQKTQDIQDKVEILERVRCQAPDPLAMLFGDNGRSMGRPERSRDRERNNKRSPQPQPQYPYSPPTFSPMEYLDYSEYVDHYNRMLMQQQPTYLHPESMYPPSNHYMHPSHGHPSHHTHPGHAHPPTHALPHGHPHPHPLSHGHAVHYQPQFLYSPTPSPVMFHNMGGHADSLQSSTSSSPSSVPATSPIPDGGPVATADPPSAARASSSANSRINPTTPPPSKMMTPSPSPSPLVMRGPDRTKSLSLHSPRSAFSPPPRSPSIEDVYAIGKGTPRSPSSGRVTPRTPASDTQT